jgi:hypothetical protein
MKYSHQKKKTISYKIKISEKLKQKSLDKKSSKIVYNVYSILFWFLVIYFEVISLPAAAFIYPYPYFQVFKS